MDEVNSQNYVDENCSEVPSPEDASGLGYTVGGQTEMGTDNKISPTDREIIKGRSEVEPISSSSNEKKCVESPSNDGGANVMKAKHGRPKKGTRVPTRQSERARLERRKKRIFFVTMRWTATENLTLLCDGSVM